MSCLTVALTTCSSIPLNTVLAKLASCYSPGDHLQTSEAQVPETPKSASNRFHQF